MIRTIEQIRINKIKCIKCGDIIESIDVHDFKWCSCGAVAVDGGREYLKRVGNKEEFEELSHFIKLAEITTNGFEIVKNALSKKDITFKNTHCHVCGSDNVTFQKGEGELIIGDDTIALVCHDCKKVYGFSDVNYKDEKYREIYLNCSKGCD